MRDDVKTIRIKNQKSTGGCWAFATLSALETNLMCTQNEVRDFSERHLVYSTLRNFKNGQINEDGYNKGIPGGSSLLAFSYMTSGRGPINESDMPFEDNENLIDLSEIQGKTVQKKLENWIAFPKILKQRQSDGTLKYYNYTGSVLDYDNQVIPLRNNIKRHILNYGAVTAATYSGNTFDGESQQYYYRNWTDPKDGKIYPAYYNFDEKLEDHEVTLIGWDDNFAKENFYTPDNVGKRPIHDGAYLAMNSWGKVDGALEEGLYYISYDDPLVEYSNYGVISADNIDYDHIYQYDPLGPSVFEIFKANELYGTNIFEKKSNREEKLREISIAVNVNEKCDVYLNEYGKKSKLLKSGVDLRTGYTTIKFDEPVSIKSDIFAVIVRYYNPNNEGKVSIGLESSDSVTTYDVPVYETNDASTKNTTNNDYYKYATSNYGESKIGIVKDGNIDWDDLKDVSDVYSDFPENANLCIKAFTEEYIPNEITSQVYTIKENAIYIAENTDYTTFLNNLNEIGITLLDKSGNKLENTDRVVTGMKVTPNEKNYYDVIIKGDANEDGKIDIGDTVAMKLDIVGEIALTGNGRKAADVDLDGYPSKAIDLARLVDYQIGIIDEL